MGTSHGPLPPPLALDEARGRLLAAAMRTATELVALEDAAGRVLATDLTCAHPLPPFDHSAMDGYAISSGDLEGSGPWVLEARGESGAGKPGPALVPGTACRIFTGAPIPQGADAVVMQEHVVRDGARVRIGEPCKPGQHIRRAGEDLAQGQLALSVGTRLGPGALALAGMLGTPAVAVARRPRVAILCTGDELRRVGEPERPGAIFESNSAALAALATQAGAVVRIEPVARDDAGGTLKAILAALDGTDVLLTVGGVSVGDHDVVRPALERAGATLDFWRVAIKPGRPLAVGHTSVAHILGLPGNPSSAIVTFVTFGVPLLRAMQGDARPLPVAIRARLEAPRKRAHDRVELARAALDVVQGEMTLRVLDNQSSGAATSLAYSDGLAFIPAGEGPLAAGSVVDFVRWSDA